MQQFGFLKTNVRSIYLIIEHLFLFVNTDYRTNVPILFRVPECLFSVTERQIIITIIISSIGGALKLEHLFRTHIPFLAGLPTN